MVGLLKRLLPLMLAGYLVLRLIAHPVPPHPFFTPRVGEHRPLVFAHQGGEGEWPCNTLFALENSDRLGADVLDVDVHLSRDGQLVLCHDATLERTTDGTGPVKDRSAADLAGLDAGYRFTTDGGRTYPYRGKGFGVPRLQEVLQRFPERRFGIEVKVDDPAAVTELLRLLRHEQAVERTLLSSFHDSVLQQARRDCPGLATSASPAEVRWFLVLSALHQEGLSSPAFQALQVPVEHKGRRVLSRRLVDAAHARGVQVVPWTLNEPAVMREAMGLGVEGINTDYPTRLLTEY